MADTDAPQPASTRVTLPAREGRQVLLKAVRAATRQVPLPVTLDGQMMNQKHFFDGAVHCWEWHGIEFGVFRDRHRGIAVPDANFHGLTLTLRLPHVVMVHCLS